MNDTLPVPAAAVQDIVSIALIANCYQAAYAEVGAAVTIANARVCAPHQPPRSNTDATANV